MTVFVFVYESDGVTPVSTGIVVYAKNVYTGEETSSSGSEYWTTLLESTPAGTYDIYGYALYADGRRLKTETKRFTYQGESAFEVRLSLLPPPPEEVKVSPLPALVFLGLIVAFAYAAMRG